MVSSPSPELHPVTMMRLPVRSIPASTLSAVVRRPNGMDGVMEKKPLGAADSTAACHSNRSRHTIHKTFFGLPGLLESTRSGVHRAAKVAAVHYRRYIRIGR